MREKKHKKNSDYEERQAAFKSLPPAIKNSLTPEETEAFLESEVWPDSLFNKLSEFIFKIS